MCVAVDGCVSCMCHSLTHNTTQHAALGLLHVRAHSRSILHHSTSPQHTVQRTTVSVRACSDTATHEHITHSYAHDSHRCKKHALRVHTLVSCAMQISLLSSPHTSCVCIASSLCVWCCSCLHPSHKQLSHVQQVHNSRHGHTQRG